MAASMFLAHNILFCYLDTRHIWFKTTVCFTIATSFMFTNAVWYVVCFQPCKLSHRRQWKHIYLSSVHKLQLHHSKVRSNLVIWISFTIVYSSGSNLCQELAQTCLGHCETAEVKERNVGNKLFEELFGHWCHFWGWLVMY